MLHFDGPVKDIVIVDENGKPLSAGDHNRRFFEASWMHKYNGKYYFSYSTGDTHYICYAIGDNPYGPFTYQGIILTLYRAGPTMNLLFSLKVNGTSFTTIRSYRAKHICAM